MMHFNPISEPVVGQNLAASTIGKGMQPQKAKVGDIFAWQGIYIYMPTNELMEEDYWNHALKNVNAFPHEIPLRKVTRSCRG